MKYISTITQFYVGVKVHQCNFGSSDDGLDPKLVYVVNDEEGASSTSEKRTSSSHDSLEVSDIG